MKTGCLRFLLLLPVLLGLCPPGIGQGSSQKALAQMPASARQLIAIKVIGSKRFPEAAIAAQTGLQMGTAVSDDDFKKAARNLGDTGAFSDIAYSFTFSAAGTKLELHVTDVEKFVPARFEDFVWFTDTELRSRIKEHMPMFDGELPLSGENAVPEAERQDVLDRFLAQVVVDAIYLALLENVVNIVVQFTGAGEAELPSLETAGQRMPDREYSKARLNQLVQRQLLPVYHARGYLKATFGDPQPKMVKEPGVESDEEGPRNQSVVDVTFAVSPGQQYKLKSLDWAGNHELTTETLQKMVHAEPGKLANTERLGDDIKAIQTLYGSRGFLKATIKPEAQFDDASGTAAIHMDVKEDSVYHMGELEFRGLDNSLTAKLRSVWKIRAGEVYDATYLSDYLPVAQKLLPANLDWEVSPHVTANIREKTVDVDLIYSVKAPK